MITKLPELQCSKNPSYLKERIYGILTLLAVNIWIFIHIDTVSSQQNFATIITAILWLWLAGLFSEIIAHKFTKHIHNKEELFIFMQHAFKNSLGILHSAYVSIFLNILAFFEIISLNIAVFSSIILLTWEFLMIVFFSQKNNSFLEKTVITIIQLAIFAIIILLKTSH